MKKLLFNIYYLLLPNQLAQIVNSKLKIENLLCLCVFVVKKEAGAVYEGL